MAFSEGEYIEKFILPMLLHDLRNLKSDFMAVMPDAPARSIDSNGIAVNKVGQPIAVDWDKVTAYIDDDIKDFLVENKIIPWQYFSTTPFSTDKEEIRTSALDRRGILNTKSAEAIQESRRDRVLHAIAPDDDQSAVNPVMRTTGEDRDGSGTGALQVVDLITFAEKFDELNLTQREKLYMVLCGKHKTDLAIDAFNKGKDVFQDIYVKTKNGEPIDNHSWKFFVNQKTIFYAADNTKKALGAANIATDKPASIAFYAPHTLKAFYNLTSHYAPMSEDTRNNPPRDEMRWTGNAIGTPLWKYGHGAIVSKNIVE
jgi:hypothetical protein